MDNLSNSGVSSDNNLNKPNPFDDDTSGSNVSHSPLNLGGGSRAEAPKVEAVSGAVTPVTSKPAETASSSERITGVKTFFTKLHSGAIAFLDEQITNWLRNNPGIVIKRTNTVVGEIQAKKTEPNIVVTIWY
ncbi:MAG: hypothetical protein JSV82_05785 [Planctomycetota bacterium]|nr:MAG: hypothetical protein JSV82_05785 [Planctomycetota bacterium]